MLNVEKIWSAGAACLLFIIQGRKIHKLGYQKKKKNKTEIENGKNCTLSYHCDFSQQNAFHFISWFLLFR